MALSATPLPLCSYCKRQTKPPAAPSPLALTLDHVLSQSRGGKLTIPACYHCNQLKGDMSPHEWRRWRKAHPRWWEMPEFQRWKSVPFQRKFRHMTPFMRLFEGFGDARQRIPKPKMTAAETREWLSSRKSEDDSQ